VYSIPETFPISFTHIYCPLCRFDEVVQKDNWLIMKKDGAYLALWSSGKMEPYNDALFDCEFRVYDREAAYLCAAGRKEDFRNIEDFSSYARRLAPFFDPETKTLTTQNGFRLTYKEGRDNTQYIE
jgi:hypothetical protein